MALTNPPTTKFTLAAAQLTSASVSAPAVVNVRVKIFYEE